MNVRMYTNKDDSLHQEQVWKLHYIRTIHNGLSNITKFNLSTMLLHGQVTTTSILTKVFQVNLY